MQQGNLYECVGANHAVGAECPRWWNECKRHDGEAVCPLGVHSLKEKRMIVKSLCEKLRNKFHVSVIESDEQDIHQTVILSIVPFEPDRDG